MPSYCAFAICSQATFYACSLLPKSPCEICRPLFCPAPPPKQEVGDVCLGSVFPPSSKRANEVRTALLLAGFPDSVPAYTVNRWAGWGAGQAAGVGAQAALAKLNRALRMRSAQSEDQEA